MNLFRNLELELHILNSISLPHPTPETRRGPNNAGSKAHPSYMHAQKFSSVNIFNRMGT